MLSIIGSIYDPLGLVSPIVLKGKILQRNILTEEYLNDVTWNWDDPLPPEAKKGMGRLGTRAITSSQNQSTPLFPSGVLWSKCPVRASRVL